MQFRKTTVAASIIVMTGAVANPIAALEAGNELEKRATEGVYLLNCGSQAYTAVVYCTDYTKCDFQPSSANECFRGFIPWEASNQKCTFSTGVTFSWLIDSNAQGPNFSPGSKVGSGNNGAHSFNIYKDTKGVLFTDSDGRQCTDIYKALPA